MLIQSAWPPGVPAFGALCPFSTLSSTISCGTFFVFAAVARTFAHGSRSVARGFGRAIRTGEWGHSFPRRYVDRGRRGRIVAGMDGFMLEYTRPDANSPGGVRRSRYIVVAESAASAIKVVGDWGLALLLDRLLLRRKAGGNFPHSPCSTSQRGFYVFSAFRTQRERVRPNATL
jgi:hypothetical protein